MHGECNIYIMPFEETFRIPDPLSAFEGLDQRTGPSDGVKTANLDRCASGLEPGPWHSMLTMLSTSL